MYFKKRKQNNFINPKIYRRTTVERNSNFNFKWFLVFIILIILLFLLWWIFYSDFFKIKNIEIKGNLNESIKQEINQFYNKNIFLFTIGKMDSELIKKQTSISQLNIIKGIPDTLKIEVIAREPMIRWKTQEKIYYIDSNGIIFDLNADIEKYNVLPLVIDMNNLEPDLGRKIVTNDFVDFIKKIQQKIPEITQKEINEILINETTIHVEVKLKDSCRVLFNTMENWDNQIKLFDKLFKDKINEIKEYIDLRVANRAYYK